VSDSVSTPSVTDEEVIGYVSRYLDGVGLGGSEITMSSQLIDLGLDSISTVELLLSARDELVEAGRLPEDVSLKGLPKLESVEDLAVLFRSLAEKS
jgi:acyl carrier protein